jgi:colicin import membrane protein
MDATTPTVGHNSKAASLLIEEDPALIYREPELLDQAVAEFEATLAKAEVMLATDKGRKEIASRAAKFSGLKVQIENAGLALTEEWRRKTDEVNSVKKKVKVNFDRLRDLAREPLTKWEDAKKEREEKIANNLRAIDDLGAVRHGATVGEVEGLISILSEISITEEALGEFLLIAEAKAARARDALNGALERAKADERDRAELARLRAEADARAAEDRKREAEEAQRRAEAERQEREAQERAQAETRAAEQAAAAERDRLAREIAAKEAAERQAREEEERRARDFMHRKAVEDAVVNALVTEHGLVGNRAIATRIFAAIAEGKVPHLTVKF